MSARSFVDTNILLYADSPNEPQKQSIALALIAEQLRAGSGVISMQVLHEYAAAGLKKLALADSLVHSRIALYSRFDIVTPSVHALTEPAAIGHDPWRQTQEVGQTARACRVIHRDSSRADWVTLGR